MRARCIGARFDPRWFSGEREKFGEDFYVIGEVGESGGGSGDRWL